MVDLSKVNIHWFPGHMSQGVKAMEKRLHSAACLIELRDARIPLSSANPLLTDLVKATGVRHFVAFNKVDLARSAPLKRVMDNLRSQHNTPSMALRAVSDVDCQRLIKNLIDSLRNLQHDPHYPVRIMIAGIPNVGKSTLINGIRKVSCNTEVKAAKTGKLPGITRLISEQIKISEDPKVYIWDTPGILSPKITDPDIGMRLVSTGAILDKQVGEYLIVEYLLEKLQDNKRLKELLKVDKVPLDISEFLEVYGRRFGILEKGSGANFLNAANSFISRFRDGAFGKICLDPVNDDH